MTTLQEMIENIYKLYLKLSKKEEKLRKVREALAELGISNYMEPYFDVSEGEVYAIINRMDFPEEFSDVVEMIDEIVSWGYDGCDDVREVSKWGIVVTTAKLEGYNVPETYASLGELLPLVTAKRNGEYEERYYYLGSVDDVNVYLVIEIRWLTN